MPMRVGEMMVIIRAEDFASRTLRRVGTEFRTLSRAQAMQARQALRLGGVNEQLRSIGIIQRRNRVLTEQVAIQDKITAAEQMAARASSKSFATRQRAFAAQSTIPALQGQLAGLTGELNRSQAAVDALPGKYRRLALSMTDTAAAEARLIGQQHMLQTSMKNLERMIPIERLDNLGHSMSGIGRTMQLFGAGTSIALGLAARSAAEFDTSISSAATQARDLGADASQVQDRIDQLTNGFNKNGVEVKGVLDLMRQFPASQEDMAAGAYEIFSGMDLENKGIIDVAKGLGLLETADKIAVAGNVSLEEATSAMITTFNNFDPQLQNTTETLDTMFDIVRFGRMRLSDFNIMMNKIAPAAADAGMALEDVGGAMAYLTTVMPSQRMVATGISRLIEALRHPDIVRGLHMMGVEVKNADGRMRAFDDIITDIAKRFPELRTGQRSAAEFFRMISAIGAGGGRGQIFTAEGRRALSEIVTHYDEWLDAQNRIEQNQGEFAATVEAQMQSLGVQWGIFVNQIKQLVLILGADAIPAFAELGGWIERFTKWFSSLDPELRRQIVRWGVFAAVGTLVAGVLLAVAGSIISLLAYLRILGIDLGKARIAALGLSTALRAIAAIAAIQVLIKVAMGGDPTAMDFIQAALAGGFLGAAFGPAGAVVGGITLPVVVSFIAQKSLEETLLEQIDRQTRNRKDAFGRYGRYMASQINAGIKSGLMSRNEFDAFEKQAAMLDARERGQTRGPIHPKQTKNVKDMTVALNDGEKAWKKYIEAMSKYRQEVRGHEEAMDRWKDSLIDATAQAKQEVMGNLRSMYDSFLQENERAFGELMQGPWLTSETFDLAKEWGIAPRIQDLIFDLKQQNQQFTKWRSSLDAIMKKGLPLGLINELRQLGPEEGQGVLDNILRAKPGQVNALIQQWKRKNQQIKEATKMDFVDEIERFRKAGLSMGDAIKEGFENAQVTQWFENWVKVTFPDVISSAVNQAVSEWKAANPMPTPPVMPKPPKNVQNAAGAPNTSTTTQTDNSTNVDVTIGRMEEGTPSQEIAKQRMAAFALVGAIQGALGGKR